MPTFDEAAKAYRERAFGHEEVDVEGMRVALRLLTGKELDIAHAEAAKYLKQLGLDTMLDGDQVLDRERQRQALSTALRDPSDTTRAFISAGDMRERLSPSTVAAFFAVYTEHSLRVAEALPNWPPEALDNMVEALAERPGSVLLGGLSRHDLVWMVEALAVKLRGQPSE